MRRALLSHRVAKHTEFMKKAIKHQNWKINGGSNRLEALEVPGMLSSASASKGLRERVKE